MIFYRVLSVSLQQWNLCLSVPGYFEVLWSVQVKLIDCEYFTIIVKPKALQGSYLGHPQPTQPTHNLFLVKNKRYVKNKTFFTPVLWY